MGLKQSSNVSKPQVSDEKFKKYSSEVNKIQSLTACMKVLYMVHSRGNNPGDEHRNCSKIKVLACPFCGTSSHNEIIITVNRKIYFWCKTCNANAFACKIRHVARYQIESKYPYHPALIARGVVFSGADMEFITDTDHNMHDQHIGKIYDKIDYTVI